MKMQIARQILVAIALIALSTPLAAAGAARINHDSLVADVRQLADLIEQIHPDPYINEGGRVAFHRRLQSILKQIPADGMTRMDFYRLLRPFVTAIGDAHTRLHDAYDYTPSQPGGIPLYFRVVDTSLCVFAVPEERYRPLIGALLVSVEGVPLRELLNRSRTMISAENEYQLLGNLGYNGFFFLGPFLTDLLPEWRDKSNIRVVLRDTAGQEAEYTFPVLSYIPEKWIKPDSRVNRPRPYPKGFEYTFLDPERKTALLVIDDMQSYREMYEGWIASNPVNAERAIREMYKRIHQSDAPDDIKAAMAGIPSAAETFRALVKEMRKAKTKTLLVDLRYNDGGNSTMYNILLYFLYGKKVLWRAKLELSEVERYSEYYFRENSLEEFERINRGRTVPLAKTDYDFSGDWYGRIQRDSSAVDQIKTEWELRELDKMPSFAKEYRSGKYERYYLPANVMVLSSPKTFSSGYTLMYYLFRAGAKIVGTPSAQAGNCFGEPFDFELQHSGLTGTISHKQFVEFHDDPEMGRVLRPHFPMTYDKLKSYAFDPNAEILLALDACQQ
ncbi:MAG: S41 family peptidase [candidate division WOR-3 bacterium]|nr:S41 family peptidase [candidate division WOR-3 bacterium]